MDLKFAFVVACLLSLANASQFTTQPSNFKNCDSTFLVIAGDHVVESFNDIEKAKANLMKVTTRSRLIAEVNSNGILKRDPHEVGGQNQVPTGGFNKWWSGWDDINRMMDVAQQFLNLKNEKLWRDDGRCGVSYPLLNGKPGQCDPTANANEKGPCCSSGGWCGNSDAHCKCSSCVSYEDSIYFIAGGVGALREALRDMELYHPTMANLSCSMSPPSLNNYWLYHTTFYYNNTIHLYGGYNTPSTCISYSNNTEEWKTHTLSTTRRWGHSSVVLKKKVFIIGGLDGSGNYVGAESTPLPLTDQPVLTPVPNLDYKGFYQCTSKVDEDTLVVTGGHYYSGHLSPVIEYNVKTRTTTSLPSMKQPRYLHGCAVLEMDNTKWIIVAGGVNGRSQKTTEMLQMGKTSWTSLGNLNVARNGHSIAVTQRGVMVMGGKEGSSGSLSSVELLDWSAKSWRIVQPSLSKLRSYFGGALEIPTSMFDCRDRSGVPTK